MSMNYWSYESKFLSLPSKRKKNTVYLKLNDLINGDTFVNKSGSDHYFSRRFHPLLLRGTER